MIKMFFFFFLPCHIVNNSDRSPLWALDSDHEPSSVAAKTAVCNETVVKCENLDLQVSVVLLSSKISLIL